MTTLVTGLRPGFQAALLLAAVLCAGGCPALAATAPVAGISLQGFPVDHQLYPRAKIGDGLVQMSFVATSTSPTIDSLTLTLTSTAANVAPVQSTVAIGQGQSATMSAAVPVALQATTFTLTAHDTVRGNVQIANVVDVVAGDVYVVQGQSNALSTKYPEQDTQAANAADSPWTRTVGGTWDDTLSSDADHAWYVAHGNDIPASSGTIGKWPARMANDIITQQHVPIAIFNGARADQFIAYFLPNYVQPGDPGNDYKRLMSRLNAYNLAGSVRALFYYQGETDASYDKNISVWTPSFETLLTAWKNSFRNLTNVYLTQVRGCSPSANTNDIREQQRQLASGTNTTVVPQIQVMSTTAMGGFQGCHYYYSGYEQLGHWYAGLVLHDFYGGSASNTTAPAPVKITANSTGTQLFITLANRYDPIKVDAASKANFVVTTAKKGVVYRPTMVTAIPGMITLTLPSAIAVTHVSYRGQRQQFGPWITNGAGIGLLAFEDMPVSR